MADDRSPRSSTEQTVTANSPQDSHRYAPTKENNGPYPHTSWGRRRSSVRSRSSQRRPSLALQRTTTGKRTWWKFTLRDWDDDEEQDWWFASTAIPLFAATMGPLANVLSIAALVTYWRMCLIPDVPDEEAYLCPGNPENILTPLEGNPFSDPRWCYNLNAVSLALGFVGNFFLLCNFTHRIRYIIALPVTIVMWYLATAILIGITVSMHVYVPPVSPQQTYTQGFWYAVFAAMLYCICSMLLMVNMVGYFLGHYPQHFTLTDSQRTLILQTMLFFVWLAGGGAVFSKVESDYGNGTFNWSYVNALYFCDVTILTVGFGDLYTTSNAGRGLVFPYSVGGIIMLGLMVGSITKFVGELSTEKVVKRHVEKIRTRTIGRTVTSSTELTDRERKALAEARRRDDGLKISEPFNPVDRSKAIRIEGSGAPDHRRTSTPFGGPLRRATTLIAKPRKPKLLLLREEKDRFVTMRRIQAETSKFKRWSALFASISAFGTLWCIGAVVFWQCEKNIQGMSYFQALYFCYVSLLTIGYGDLAPKSNPGRPFFVVWSLLAIPTMSILVNDLGSTVISKFQQGTYTLADFTVLPKKGVWHSILTRNPRLMNWITQKKQSHDTKKRLEEGFPAGPEPEKDPEPPTLDVLAQEQEKKPSREELAKRLAKTIHKTTKTWKNEPKKRYSYEEWVEITQLIRFTARKDDEDAKKDDDDEVEELIEWDWIGEDSPMMANVSEPEFVLDRLCESMNRYIRDVAAAGRPGDDEAEEGKAEFQHAGLHQMGSRAEHHTNSHVGLSMILEKSEIGEGRERSG
ncbi:voltage-gated potassium channel [Polychaeton citri CBS 116435]|uniref:Voltage-gated potassium channel n=1 Tax=Polychaeton citri CBS 116435 TaxID=1314669 RepID=A0A9P4QB50_9PEZI|nr:voltage-gated potassium channel [Polychaeton citri CBS 116435]